MGTYYAITVGRRPRGADPDMLISVARDALIGVESRMSAHSAQSDIGRFNAAPPEEWIEVSGETVHCLHLGLQISAASGQLLDPTAGPLVNLWGFGPGGGEPQLPGEDRIAEARSTTGIDRLEIRSDPPALQKHHPELRLDLGGIAKGFAVDWAAEALDDHGVRDYCLEVGGEIRARGLNARGLPWRIAVETPLAERQSAQRIISLRDRAVATSGDYRNYKTDETVKYSHIIDPRTGHPVRHNLASVTVIDASCARTDGWATALMVAGPQAGYEMAVRENLPALFITRTANGFAEKETPGFPAS